MDLISGRGSILMLHRVRDEARDAFEPNRDMAVSPAFLDGFIAAAKKDGYAFLSLDELAAALRQGSAHRVLVLTLDDGYRDNLEQALPVFAAHGTPFAVYVATDFPERQARLWWYALEDLLRGRSRLDLADGSRLACASPAEKLAAFDLLRGRIVNAKPDETEAVLNAIFGGDYDWSGLCAREALGWDEIATLARHPLATIGAHTMSHPALARLSRDRALSEMKGSGELIGRRLGRPVRHFCYPFGGRGEADAREFGLARALGFVTATTTRWGNLYRRHRHHLQALPRIPLTNGFGWAQHRRQSWRRFLKGPVVTA